MAGAVVLAGAVAWPAAAAPATITVAGSRFTPSAVTIAAGESVTWDFTEPSHNVKGTDWSGNNAFGKGTFTRAFDAAGTFAFVCEAHPATMHGTVTVTAAAPALDPATGAVADLVAPRIAALRVSPSSVHVRLSEDALIVVELRRDGGPALRTRHRGRAGPNRFGLAPGRLRPGRYRLRIGAFDGAGNESPVRRASVRVRGR